VAIYVPPSTRRRRLVVMAAGTLVVGLAIGFGVGRATSSGVDDAVANVRSQAADAATALQRLPIEYEQAVADQGGESPQTITGAIENARAQLDAAFDDATWFGPAARQPTDEALDALVRAVRERASPAEFEADIDRAVAVIRSTFGETGTT
jgi:hypothetical protein